MARADILNILYSKNKTPLEFQFDSLWIPGMHNYINMESISRLYNIASSVLYSSKIELKIKEMDAIMSSLGFKMLASGTNRRVYNYLEDQTFLAKVAVDKAGLGDAPKEFKNQSILKPFVTKTFEISMCGTVALVERVQPINLQAEYNSIAGDIYDLIYTCIVGKYVLEDIGSNYFMNWGVRNGFGPVLLDYPYVFELDGNKLNCTKPKYPGRRYPVCGGEIDYDIGFNKLVCTECGQEYLAKDLQKAIETKNVSIMKGDFDMTRVVLLGADGEVLCDPGRSSNTILPPKPKVIENRASDGGPKVVLEIPNEDKIPEAQEFVTGSIKITAPLEQKSEEGEPDREVDKKEKFAQDMTKKFVLYNVLDESMNKYPFEQDKRANQSQRRRMVSHLTNDLKKFLSKPDSDMPSDNFISDTVKAYLDANYKFDETEDEEVKPEQKIESVFGQVSVEEEINRLHTKVEKPAKSYEEFEDDDAPKYEKIRQNKKQQSVLDNY